MTPVFQCAFEGCKLFWLCLGEIFFWRKQGTKLWSRWEAIWKLHRRPIVWSRWPSLSRWTKNSSLAKHWTWKLAMSFWRKAYVPKIFQVFVNKTSCLMCRRVRWSWMEWTKTEIHLKSKTWFLDLHYNNTKKEWKTIVKFNFNIFLYVICKYLNFVLQITKRLSLSDNNYLNKHSQLSQESLIK